MPYDFEDVLPSGIRIVPMRSEHADHLEALQRIVFPHLAEEEILHAEQYRAHLQIFPEGQMVALHGSEVVGATTTMRYDLDITCPQPHRFVDIMAGGWLTTHKAHGQWLYGLDVSVHPLHRKKGIARGLYRARQQLCRRLHLQGQVIVGMLNGYAQYSKTMDIDTYFEKVRRNELFDPTVSAQQKIGFHIIALMKDYLHDPTCGNAGVMMILPIDKEV